MEHMRRMLFLVLLAGIAGTGAELLLTSHTADVWQKLPVALLGAAVPIVVVVALNPARVTVAVMRGVMVLFMAAGALGMYLHYDSNAEFAVELDPALSGFALFAEALTRPTPPPLAPGTMIMLGLLGLVCCYRIDTRKGD
ncbi:MAG: hypothetical protein WD690_12010 [Vicinamibacterales bacterium]